MKHQNLGIIEDQNRTDFAPRKSNMNLAALVADMEFLLLSEVAAMLRLSEITIQRMVSKGLLPVYRTCRKLLFKKQEVLEYLEGTKSNGLTPSI